jgi:16S rRNA (uracil1498-N3)-methyltransferase
MSIDALTSVGQALTTITGPAVFLSTEASAPQLIATAFGDATDSISLFIGPEGGWTDDEIALFERHHVRPLKLTNTVLRVETAAIAAMAVVACSLTSNPRPPR